MKRELPEAVQQAPEHSMILVPGEAAVTIYIREDEFALARYPQHCPVELALPIWDDGDVINVALLVRLAGSNYGTFDQWLNAAKPADLRIVQLLAMQKLIDLFLVSDRLVRPFEEVNPLMGKAAGLIATLRIRKSWRDVPYETRLKRLQVLYPTSDSLWRGARRLQS